MKKKTKEIVPIPPPPEKTSREILLQEIQDLLDTPESPLSFERQNVEALKTKFKAIGEFVIARNLEEILKNGGRNIPFEKIVSLCINYMK